MQGNQCVIVIIPEQDICLDIKNLIIKNTSNWNIITLFNKEAKKLLILGKKLLKAIEQNSNHILDFRQEFSEKVISYFKDFKNVERLQVISSEICPIDLVYDEFGNWGDRFIISHLPVNSCVNSKLILGLFNPIKKKLLSYVLHCPMAMDRNLPRHEQDIIIAATELESSCAVEIILQPSYKNALKNFNRDDISILHIDTHGTEEKIMLGASREGRKMAKISDFSIKTKIPLIILIGCELTGGTKSIGAGLLNIGIKSIIGPCIKFTSLALGKTDELQVIWYKTLLLNIINGLDIGKSQLIARQKLKTDSLFKYTWLLLGSSILYFEK